MSERANRNAAFKTRDFVRAASIVFVLAVVLNFPWEMAESVLFTPMAGNWLIGTWRCVVASLGDGLIVMMIVAAGRLWNQSINHRFPATRSGHVVMMLLGVAIAIAIER